MTNEQISVTMAMQWITCVLLLLAQAQGLSVYRHDSLANTVVVVPDHDGTEKTSVVLINGRVSATCQERCCLVTHNFEPSTNIHLYDFGLKSQRYTLLEGHAFASLQPSSHTNCRAVTLETPKRPRVLAYFTVENTPSVRDVAGCFGLFLTAFHGML